MTNLPLLALLLALWPIAALAGPGRIEVSTGITGAHSAQRVVTAAGPLALVAEARVLSHGQTHAFLVEIGQNGAGGPLRVSRARADGRELDFEPAVRQEPFCNGSGQCAGPRVGAIFMDREAFARAAANGLNVRISGPGGAVDMVLPPSLFAEAWRLAARVH